LAPAPTPVALGGDDAQTRSLQEALNKSGADPQLAVDGSFGRLTRAALMAFQAAHALPPDGFATADTMATLRRLAV
jgi:peptidoglycan hydrolase-like protein with peptidoglycan-binding domain